MDPVKKGRAERRVLFLGLRRDGAIFAYLATPASRLAKEIHDIESVELSGVLRELPYNQVVRRNAAAEYPVEERADFYPDESMLARLETTGNRSRYSLLSELQRIHNAGPIPGKKLNAKGEA